MKLYYAPQACSLAPHIVLRELDLPFELIRVDNRSKTTAHGADFLVINPKGYVAALQLDNAQVLTEGPAIVQYLADLAPEKQLAPANGSVARYQLQAWLTFIGTEVHKSFSPFFNPKAPQEWKDIARKVGRHTGQHRDIGCHKLVKLSFCRRSHRDTGRDKSNDSIS